MGRTILSSAFIRRLVIVVAPAAALAGMLYLAAFSENSPSKHLGE
jgi:hypothetical protein